MKRILLLVIMLSMGSYAHSMSRNRNTQKDFNWKNNVKHYGKYGGLKVVWWNLGCGAKGMISASNNLNVLTSNSHLKPDVLILGEYCENHLTSKVKNMLHARYPFVEIMRRYTQYHVDDDGVENGVRIFSRFKLEDVKAKRLPAGPWLTRDLGNCSHAKKENSGRYAFPYIKFSVRNSKRRKYTVVQNHLPQPWSLWDKCKGKVSTAKQAIIGKRNPNYFHAVQLIYDFENARDTLLIGDYNTVKNKRVLGIKVSGMGYKKLKKAFGSSVIETDAATTTSGATGSVSIDHAFITTGLSTRYAHVLPLAGSDHYPIYVILE